MSRIIFIIFIFFFSTPSFAIVNGYVPKADDPMAARTAALLRLLNDGRYSACTIALLDEGFAITAAHCVAKLASGEVWFVNSYPELQKSQTEQHFSRRRKVLSWRTPNDYANNPNPANDIALLRFEGDLPDGVSTFQLPSKKISETTAFSIAGFGYQSQLEENPDGLLRVVNLPPSAFISPGHEAYFSFDQANVGGACAGDSGAPLATEENGIMVLAGIVGGGLGVDRQGKRLELKDTCNGVSVFPSVSHHKDWILETMKRM